MPRIWATGGGSSFTVISGAPLFSSGIILVSPDGTQWLLTIDNSGNLHTTKLNAGTPIGLLLILTRVP